jgi:hypothetical protein
MVATVAYQVLQQSVGWLLMNSSFFGDTPRLNFLHSKPDAYKPFIEVFCTPAFLCPTKIDLIEFICGYKE